MLVRVNAAAGGIANYLETGIKRGREFARDLIDERLVLDGDLALVDTLIDTIETAQDGDAKYLHITLGLSERFTTAQECGPGEVNLAKLQAITEAYRDALMCAHDRSEYAWYAEAHVPKVTHELHESTGEFVERLPHVHIVLPMRNLADGRYLNPFGFGRETIPYAQAIQEDINRRFGLQSPLDSPRDRPRPAALAKHNARLAPGTPAQIREAVVDLVRSGQARSFDELAQQLREFGDVRVRAGKDGDCLNVKPSWAAKGINLKEFTRDGFEAAAAAARSTPARSREFDALVARWRDTVSLEARFVSKANRPHYKKLEPAERAAWLQAKALEAAQRLQQREQRWSLRAEQIEKTLGEDRSAILRAALRANQQHEERARAAAPAQTLSSVRSLSGLATLGRGLDAAGPRFRARRDPDRKRFTVAGTLIATRDRKDLEAERLKTDTSPSIVLQVAARLYGVDAAAYDVGSGRDGSPRILHAGKQYNMGDFFTKHLRVPWDEARPVLTDCYHATLSDGMPAPDRELWRSFSAWRQRAFEGRKAALEQARAENRMRLAGAREIYRSAKLNAAHRPARDRAQVLAAARAEHLVAQARARELARQEREALKRPSRNAEYRAFLTELAGAGNLAALGELRRVAPVDREPFEGIAGEKGKPVLPLPSYRIDHHGRVTYLRDDQAIVTDSARGVSVVKPDDSAYDIALKVAVARYGNALTLQGDRLFTQRMLEAARRSRPELVIRDADRPNAPPVRIQSQQRER